jgi:hypothetical protein
MAATIKVLTLFYITCEVDMIRTIRATGILVCCYWLRWGRGRRTHPTLKFLADTNTSTPTAVFLSAASTIFL